MTNIGTFAEFMHAVKHEDLAAIDRMVAREPEIVNRVSPALNSSPLFHAIYSNSIRSLKPLIENGANIHFIAKRHGTTALYVAVELFKNEIVKLLLDAGADPCARPHDGTSALHIAVLSGNCEALEIIFEHIGDYQSKDAVETRERLLDRACRSHHARCVDYLLARGFTLDVFSAIRRGDVAALRRCVADDPSCLHRRIPEFGHLDDGQPLHLAVYYGHVEIIRLLIGAGADVNALTRTGMSPTSVHLFDALRGDQRNEPILSMVASAGARRGVVQCVLEDDSVSLAESLRADSVSSPEIECSLLLSVQWRRTRCAEILLGHPQCTNSMKCRAVEHAIVVNPSFVSVLLIHGVDLSADDSDPPCIFSAAMMSDPKRLELIIDHGVNANVRIFEGELTVLHHAAMVEEPMQAERMKLLLEMDAVDVNSTAFPPEDLTPLHIAVLCKAPVEVIELLVAHGANTTKRDSMWDATALDLARYVAYPKECPSALVDLLS